MPGLRRLAAGTAAALALWMAGESHAAAAARQEQVTRLGMGQLIVDGASGSQGVRGVAVLHTPASFRRTSHDGAPSAHFSVTMGNACSATVLVSKRALATRLSPAAQARRSTRGERMLLGFAAGGDRAWRLSELRAIDPDTQEATSARVLYGLDVMRLAPRRWLQVRAFARFTDGCSAGLRRHGAAAAGLESMLRTASNRAHLVTTKR